MPPARIHIIGGPGSGKTTLARRLAKQWGYPCVDLDDVYWATREKPPVVRPAGERDAMLAEILNGKTWIVEGAHDGWTGIIFGRADCVIVLNTPTLVRAGRVIKRQLLRWWHRKSDYSGTQCMGKIVYWCLGYNCNRLPGVLRALKKHNATHTVCRNKKEIEKLVARLEGGR